MLKLRSSSVRSRQLPVVSQKLEMKASLTIRDPPQKPLLRLKVPVTILSLPFCSGATMGDSSELSFNLSTACNVGPSLIFSYRPKDPLDSFSLTLKSGIGLYGSPRSSSLALSAHFSLGGMALPFFSLQIRPRIGDFSLKKTMIFSSLANSDRVNIPVKENGGFLLNIEKSQLLTQSSSWHPFFSNIPLNANTKLPLLKQASMNFRWRVHFLDVSQKLPSLTVDKIGIERTEYKPSSKTESRELSVATTRDRDVLRPFSVWMGKEVEAMQKENMLLKEHLEDLNSAFVARSKKESETPNPVTRGDTDAL